MGMAQLRVDAPRIRANHGPAAGQKLRSARRAADQTSTPSSDMEWSKSVRHGIPLSILAVDIDHFKNFNDRTAT